MLRDGGPAPHVEWFKKLKHVVSEINETEPMNGDAYRRGYREGWLAAIHRMRTLVEERGISFRDAYIRCYEYRKRLHAWTLQKDGAATTLYPPEYEE